jgi:hypothetical protein
VAAAALSLLIAGVLTAAGGDLTLPRHAIVSGGGSLSVGNYSLQGAIGQPVAGTIRSPGTALCAGFWCPARIQAYTTYLPLVIR